MMNKSEVIEILEHEIACVKECSNCCRLCYRCPLLHNAAEVISALRYAIGVITEFED